LQLINSLLIVIFLFFTTNTSIFCRCQSLCNAVYNVFLDGRHCLISDFSSSIPPFMPILWYYVIDAENYFFFSHYDIYDHRFGNVLNSDFFHFYYHYRHPHYYRYYCFHYSLIFRCIVSHIILTVITLTYLIYIFF